jgi:hypothetical protein
VSGVPSSRDTLYVAARKLVVDEMDVCQRIRDLEARCADLEARIAR